MSLTRYVPLVTRAFLLPVDHAATAVQAAMPALVIGALSKFALMYPDQGGPELSIVLQIVGYGILGVMWGQFLGRGPHLPNVPPHFLPRVLAWGFALQILQGFEVFPMMLAGPLFVGYAQPEILSLVVMQAFQLMIGGMFLILPHLAMLQKGMGGPRLQEMVVAGGLAVGLGYVLVRLPFILIEHSMPRLGLNPDVTVDFIILAVVNTLVWVINLLVMTGYFTLVWSHLRATVKPMAADREPQDQDENQTKADKKGGRKRR